jgi:hypothetical protein
MTPTPHGLMHDTWNRNDKSAQTLFLVLDDGDGTVSLIGRNSTVRGIATKSGQTQKNI